MTSSGPRPNESGAPPTEPLVVDLSDDAAAQLGLTGGKGAHLAQLCQLDGMRIPAGFCVTTHAYRRFVAQVPSLDARIDELSRATDAPGIRALTAGLRHVLETTELPPDVAAAIAEGVGRFGEHTSYAVRSSATAEDLPTASFAGQQDSYLQVRGASAVLEHVRRCWASLFTERAVLYRQQQGIDQRRVAMAVVVQEMVPAQAAGVLFTADPITSSRAVARVEAGVGLGEALVAGLVTPDVFTVRDGEVVTRRITAEQPALTDSQLVRLVDLGRYVEDHLGAPQDIEWCLVDDEFAIVQSRPITTLYPVPRADDAGYHVYVSVGHGQMMTDAMKPLGLSVFQLTAAPRMLEAGGRLFVDVAPRLASPASREGFLALMTRSDPLIGDALQTLVDRGDVIAAAPEPAAHDTPEAETDAAGHPAAPVETDPAIVQELIRRTHASVAAAEHAIASTTGTALIEAVLADIQALKRVLFDPLNTSVILAGMEATWWLNDHLHTWLGDRNAADTLTRSAPGNVTAEMGLALLDVADAIRPHPQVVAFLRDVTAGDLATGDLLDELPKLDGGRAARAALEAWLDAYGMRCVGEIDITRPRWREDPRALVPAILGDIASFEPGESTRRFEKGRRDAERYEHDVLERLRALPDGRRKADETKRMIDRARVFNGYREHPKYGIVCRYLLYKRALLAQAERLVTAGVLRDAEDVFYLSLAELDDVIRTDTVDPDLINRRKDAFTAYERLTPPRVITSEGEILSGAYRRDGVPPGALTGLPVSTGLVDGRARVVQRMEEAELEPGDILVTTHTDPSWTPVFVGAAGLVTEVGGQMTHGAVIAREYGLPAVVGVVDAMALIPDGHRIRVDGTHGYVELLE